MLTDNKANGIWSAVAEKSTGLRQDEFIGEFARAIEAEVAAQAGQGPRGLLYRFNEEDWNFTEDATGQFDLEPGSTLETQLVFAAPVACPKCAGKVQNAYDWMKRALGAEQRGDVLQAKVAEQSAEISATIRARIDERKESNEVIGNLRAEIERLRESNRRLNHRCQDAESAAQAKVQEAEKVGGYFLGSANQFLINGYRAEVERIAELITERDDAQNMCIIGSQELAEQAALIEKSEKALSDIVKNPDCNSALACSLILEDAEEVLSAISAQKGGAE